MKKSFLNMPDNVANKNPSVAPTNEGVENSISMQVIPSHDTANSSSIKDLSNNSAKAQRERLLAYLRLHKSITTTHAREHLNIYDPRVRKHELVRSGYHIETTRVSAVTCQGYQHKVGLYTLIEDIHEEVQS